jgi:hypothetical protein
VWVFTILPPARTVLATDEYETARPRITGDVTMPVASRTGFFRVALGGTKILEAYDKHRAGITLGEFLCTLNEDEPNAASYRFAVVEGGTTSTSSKCRASRSPLFSYLEKLFCKGKKIFVSYDSK